MALESGMNKYMRLLLVAIFSLLAGCDEKSAETPIKFAVCADYPPFEYYDDGKIVGFDIDLAMEIAKKLSKAIAFEDMQLPAMLASVGSGMVDAAISSLAATREREKNYDFSTEYYSESFASVYKQDHPITTKSQLENIKIACQLGSTMEIWLRKNISNVSIVSVDNNNQAIELLKAGHVTCVFIDEINAPAFCKKNPGLAYAPMAKSGDGYAIMLKKGSNWKEKINNALKELASNGTIEKLKKKWLME
jgi:polar amino acid transport system substrate-binding protein